MISCQASIWQTSLHLLILVYSISRLCLSEQSIQGLN